MIESFLAVSVFWSTYVFTAGAFWVSLVEIAPYTSFKYIYKNYMIYLFICWFPLVVVICFVVDFIGDINQYVLQSLYFIGSGVIFYLSFKILITKFKKGKKIDFNWKTMSLISLSNPKTWIIVPTGFLAAKFSELFYINTLVFFAIGVPIYLTGIFAWGMLGKIGAKISPNKISYFNSLLLAFFGCYLLYEGINLLEFTF